MSPTIVLSDMSRVYSIAVLTKWRCTEYLIMKFVISERSFASLLDTLYSYVRKITRSDTSSATYYYKIRSTTEM